MRLAADCEVVDDLMMTSLSC